MSTNSTVHEKPDPRPARLEIPRSSEYSDLIRRFFRTRSVLAVIGAGTGSRSDDAVHGIAAGLSAAGNRVVVVDVTALLQTGSSHSPKDCSPAGLPNVLRWPAVSPDQISLQPVRLCSSEPNWLPALRREFDAVILDCPPRQMEPAAVDIAAMADFAVLVVESGVTPKQQIRSDQHSLELQGVKLAGCVLMERR